MPHADGTVSITVNGEHKRVAAGMTIAALASELGLVPEKIAVERNLEVVPRSTLGEVIVDDGDDLEIVHFVGGGDHVRAIDEDRWTVAGRSFRSRLIVGTGKYKDFAQNAAALEASGAEIVTVAVRRVNVSDRNAPMLTDYIDPKKVTYLPNTAGCFDADSAIRTLRLAREAGREPVVMTLPDTRGVRGEEVAAALAADPAISHVAMVYSETGSGIVNDPAVVGAAVRAAGKRLIVDAVSAFGVLPFDLSAQPECDAVLFTSNKCLEGLPGIPSMHLLDVKSSASHSGCAFRSKGSAPKADTASMISRRSAARTAAPTAAGSLTMPLPVSE